MLKSCKGGKYHGELKVKQYLCRGCVDEKGCWPGGVVKPATKKSRLLKEVEKEQERSGSQLVGGKSDPKVKKLQETLKKSLPSGWLDHSLW